MTVATNTFSRFVLAITSTTGAVIPASSTGQAFYLTAIQLESLEPTVVQAFLNDEDATTVWEASVSPTTPTVAGYFGERGLYLGVGDMDLTVTGFTTPGSTSVIIIGYYGAVVP